MPCRPLLMPLKQITKSAFARPGRRSSGRPSALALALGVAVAGDFGYNYLTTGRYLEIDRRRLCEGGFHASSRRRSPATSRRCWSATTRRSRPASCWRRSTTATSRRRSTRPAPTSPRPKPRCATSTPSSRCSSRSSSRARPTSPPPTPICKFAQEERARYDGLMKTGSGTMQRAQQTDAALRASNAQLQHAKSGLLAAQRKVDVLTTQRAQATRAARSRPRGRSSRPTLNLSYTEITAPVDGTVGARSLRVGQYVQAGTQLMAVVPLDAVYVVANFKETQLTHVRSGQPVELDDRQLSRHQAARPCRQPVAGQRAGIRAAAARQRHRQFHQDRAARAGEDRARRSQP